MAPTSLCAYVAHVMKKAWLPWLAAVVALPIVATRGTGVADMPSTTEGRPLTHHLGVAVARMDPGQRSREYRESLAYLRQHAPEAVSEIGGLLLRAPGSFHKWQVTYLVGEFGDESAIALLRIFMDEPMPRARLAREGSHETDISHSEEMMSRVQAVSSTARIAFHRPKLRDQAIETLIAAAQGDPLLRDSAMFELQKLMGPDFQSLRRYFSQEDARYFQPFMPPPRWQGLLGRRMQKHRRQGQELREERKPLCRAN